MIDFDVRARIQHLRRGGARRVEFGETRRAGSDDVPHRLQFSLLVRSKRHALHGFFAVTDVGEILLPFERKLHRALYALRGERGHGRVRPAETFRAKSATGEVAHDFDFFSWDAE